MSHIEPRALRPLAVGAVLFCGALAAPGFAQVPQTEATARPNRAYWLLAERFSTNSLRSVTYSTAVQPRWLGENDSLWYNWRDHNGSHFYLVTPATGNKQPLFDHAKLAA